MNQTECYRLEALMELAHSYPTGQSTAQIADRRDIPTPYLSRLLAELARSGWVHSRRGPGGGITLACTPDDISVAAVMHSRGAMPVLPPSLRQLAEIIDQAVEDAVAKISIADLARWETQSATAYDYSI